jgi:hypothetical protein
MGDEQWVVMESNGVRALSERWWWAGNEDKRDPREEGVMVVALWVCNEWW